MSPCISFYMHVHVIIYFLCLDFNMFYVLLEYKNINYYDNVIILVNKQPGPLITGILTLTPICVDLTSHSTHGHSRLLW